MKVRALVIDDNQDVADSLVLLLTTLGAVTRPAYDGHSGLRAVDEFQPDIVFIDIRMPGMDGYKIAGRIRVGGHSNRYILVALTGWSGSDHAERAQVAGFDSCLTKPAPVGAIQALLRLARP